MTRPPGRPPLDPDDPAVGVHVKMPGKAYDALYAKAAQARVSLPTLIRETLKPLIDIQTRPRRRDR
jgi:hypothetical protein